MNNHSRFERKRQPEATPLSDEETERSVIGMALMQSSVFWDAQGRVKPSHFTIPRLARIWEAMCLLAEQGKPVTREMIPLAIKNDGQADLALGAYLATILSDVPSLSFAEEFIDTLLHLAGRRALLEKLEQAKMDVMSADLGTPIEAVLEGAIGQLATAAGNTFDRHMRSYGEWAGEVRDQVSRAFEQGENAMVGFNSGLRAIDEVWGRMVGGRVYVLAGLSGGGKSALARQLTESIATQAKYRSMGWVYVASLEMSGQESATRAIAERLGIAASAIDEASLNAAMVEQVIEVADSLKNLPVMLDTKPRMRLSDIRSRMIRLKNQRGLCAAVIDHLLLIKPEGRSDSLADRVSDATIEAKLLARELEIPVILLAQVKEKSVMERASKKPNTSDLYGGETIRQNADGVGFIHRPEVLHAKEEPPKSYAEKHNNWSVIRDQLRGKAEFYTDKRRSGESFLSRDLRFDGPTMTFKDI